MNAIQTAIFNAGGVTKMARALGVTPQAVCFWRDGKRNVPLDKCTAIELVSSGTVTRRDLRPDDWQKIWPELAQAPASQAQPATENVEEQGAAHV